MMICSNKFLIVIILGLCLVQPSSIESLELNFAKENAKLSGSDSLKSSSPIGKSTGTSTTAGLTRVSKLSSSNNASLSIGKQDCILKKDGHIYDLTSLSRKNYWHFSDSDLIFIMSVCHPIKNIPSCPGSNNGVCFASFPSNHSDMDLDWHEHLEDVDFNKINFKSAGEVKESQSTPELIEEGSLRYVYDNGGECRRGRKKFTYKTELHLQCPLSTEYESSGPILMASPNCLFIFVWITSAACPKAIQTINDNKDPCIFKFSNSDYPLNLHSLHSLTFLKPITPAGTNASFEFNICGPIVNGSCTQPNTAVCDVTYPSRPRALATPDSISFNWEDDALIMKLKSKSDIFSIFIYMYCDRTAFKPIFSYTSKNATSYSFLMHTVNVCSPQASDCILEDRKLNRYDLRPLHKIEGNWQIIGKSNYNQEKSVLYYLNVCGPVNQDMLTKCPPGPIGACLTSVSYSGSRNLGYITSNPIINPDGSIIILYTGGDPCREGAHTSSTRISLICSHIEYPPVFLEVTESCQHLFEWHTPAACPVNVVAGINCEVTDPLFGYNFNLNPLRNTTSDYHITDGSQNFLLNVCGPLLSECDGEKNKSAICQIGEEEKSGGILPSKLIFNDGTIIMKFSNGSLGCGENSRWSSQIIFLCTHDEEAVEGLRYIHADESACIHHFIWHTKYACPPHNEVNCSVMDGNLFYDLTPLSNPSINEGFITSDGSQKYFMNVCRSIIHSKESRCDYDAGVCVIDLTHKSPTLTLGKVVSGPYIENGKLKIKYEEGDMCNATHKYSAVIEFECTDEQFLSYPIPYGEEECRSLFKWSSVYACPQNMTTHKEIDYGNCTTTNPLTNYIFDMNDLRGEKPYELQLGNNTLLLINVCGEVNDSRCKKDVGSCIVNKEGKALSGGKLNKMLKFHMWSTYLELNGGALCDNGIERSTRISFICREGDTPSGPVLISDDLDSCTYFVNWYTEQACERHIRCFAHSSERTIDLSPLARKWGNYEVRDPTNSSQTYLLNVCRPLNPIIGVNCYPGSSSCLVRKHQEPLGLGHTILNPTVVSEYSVHLMYSHGSDCPEDPRYSLSSRIIFLCNHTAGLGNPSFLKRAGDCQIQFYWYTTLVCPPPPVSGRQCQISFEAAKANIDLSPLRRQTPYKVSYLGRTFLVNICGASVCNDSAVCVEETGDSFGLSTQSKLYWDHNDLLLLFYSDIFCEGSITGKRSSRIFFECDPKAGYGNPVPDSIMENLHCMTVFTWKTNLTCIESLYGSPNSSSQSTNLPKNTSYPPPVTSNIQPSSDSLKPTGENDQDLSSHTWVSVAIAVTVLIAVVAASVFVVGRSSHGRRLYSQAKRTLARKGYATTSENDTLLEGETAFVYRVDEDEHVLRI